MNESTRKPESATQTSNAQNATIEAYLDELCAPLSDLPQSARDEIRQEIGAHLQSLLAMKREPERVLESALQQFGDPSEIGRLLALEWENRAWDLSGLSMAQRIEKLRELLAEQYTPQPNTHAQNLQIMALLEKQTGKGLFRTILLGFLPMAMLAILHFTRDLNFWKESKMAFVHSTALYLFAILNLIFHLNFAWENWKIGRIMQKSVFTRLRESAFGLGVSLNVSVLCLPIDKQTNASLLVATTTGVLIAISLCLEPSRKVRLRERTQWLFSIAITIVGIIPVIALVSLDLDLTWIVFFFLVVYIFVAIQFFIRWAKRGKRSQKAE